MNTTYRNFAEHFATEVTNAASNRHRDNWDTVRFGPEPPTTLRHTVRDLAIRNPLGRAYMAKRLRQQAQRMVNTERLEWLYMRLDGRARDLLVKLWAYRVLGYQRVKLPTNTHAYWQSVQQYDAKVDRSHPVPPTFRDAKLSLIDLAPTPLRLYTVPAILSTLLEPLHQYRCPTPFVVDVEPGDYVIDGGGCWGDTALIFAWKAGPNGRVISFEFVPANIDIFERNLELNPTLAVTTSIQPYALWETSGETLQYAEDGPASTVGSGKNTAPTMSLDDFCQDLPRVDFIKMDIEKAELGALRGAVETLRRFRPKLAIAIYHKTEDFWEIPAFLQSMNLGYAFTIGHHTIHAEETVLYARVPV